MSPSSDADDAAKAFERHIAFLNAHDQEGTRATMFVPSAASGAPFEIYVRGMASLVPIELRSCSGASRWVEDGVVHVLLNVELATPKGPRSGVVAMWRASSDRPFLVASKAAHWYL